MYNSCKNGTRSYSILSEENIHIDYFHIERTASKKGEGNNLICIQDEIITSKSILQLFY